VGETIFSSTETADPVLKWRYDEWGKLGEQDFPGTMKISFALPNNSVEATFRISSVKPDSSWETRTEINKNRYSEISLQAAFNRIMNLAQ
jgi:YD repeat-containing protein